MSRCRSCWTHLLQEGSSVIPASRLGARSLARLSSHRSRRPRCRVSDAVCGFNVVRDGDLWIGRQCSLCPQALVAGLKGVLSSAVMTHAGGRRPAAVLPAKVATRPLPPGSKESRQRRMPRQSLVRILSDSQLSWLREVEPCLFAWCFQRHPRLDPA